MNSTSINWTDRTWNPVGGCEKVSEGCQNCYAESIAEKFRGGKAFPDGFGLTLRPHKLSEPLRLRTPSLIFVNSMSDLFHKDVPVDFIQQVFDVMRRADWHRFQVLTKRAERLLEIDPQIDWPANVWMGVSVENQDYKYRIDLLRQTHAKIKFLSLEPLLGPLPHLNLKGINWVIVGGESGPGARPVLEEWVIDIRDQCKAKRVPFFFKQWGGVQKKRAGRLLQGETWSQMPEQAWAGATA